MRTTKIVQGWPKLWADFRALIGIFSQIVGPSLAIWANPVQFSFHLHDGSEVMRDHVELAGGAPQHLDQLDGLVMRADLHTPVRPEAQTEGVLRSLRKFPY